MRNTSWSKLEHGLQAAASRGSYKLQLNQNNTNMPRRQEKNECDESKPREDDKLTRTLLMGCRRRLLALSSLSVTA